MEILRSSNLQMWPENSEGLVGVLSRVNHSRTEKGPSKSGLLAGMVNSPRLGHPPQDRSELWQPQPNPGWEANGSACGFPAAPAYVPSSEVLVGDTQVGAAWAKDAQMLSPCKDTGNNQVPQPGTELFIQHLSSPYVEWRGGLARLLLLL